MQETVPAEAWWSELGGHRRGDPRRAPDAHLWQLVREAGVEEGAHAYVSELRWPAGVSCPRCGSTRVGALATRRKHYCHDCRYHFGVTAETVFHGTHVPLARWLVAVQLMLESEQGFPANRLQEVIGGSYKTAWFVGHRIRAALDRSSLDPAAPLALARPATVEAPAPPPRQALSGPAAEGWTLVKRLVAGAYHRPSSTHLTAYWNESRWRAERRGDEGAFRETVRALLAAGPLPYDALVDHGRPRRPAAVEAVQG